MLGCDIVNLSRFQDKPDRWAKKILTDLEQEEYNKSKNKINYLGGRWAAKEAIFKATGKIAKGSVLNSSTGKPYISDDHLLEVSISHEKNMAIAVVLKMINNT